MGLGKRIRNALRELFRKEAEPEESAEPEQPWFAQANGNYSERPPRRGEYQPLVQNGEVSWRRSQLAARFWQETQEKFNGR